MKASVIRDSSHLTLKIYKAMLLSLDGDGDGGALVFDKYTYPILFQACSVRRDERQGQQVHAHVLELGFGSDVYVVNTLMNLYSVCENAKDARRLFDESPMLDMVSWNTMLAAYVDAGNVEEATWVYNEMPLPRSTIASNSLIALFGRKNHVDDARNLFDRMPVKDMVSWTAIISCYEQNTKYEKALEMFRMMVNSDKIPVDEVALISALTACSRLAGSNEGRTIHGLVFRTVSVDYINLLNSLIHMYLCFGDVVAARRLFDSASLLDQISWNCMIAGYAQHDLHEETLGMFHEMMRQQYGSVKPDEGVLVSVITACTRLSSLEQGRLIHSYIKEMRYDPNSILGTSLVDMYMKCGCAEDAMEVFDEMPNKVVSTWNALISGLAMNGLVSESLAKFSLMTTQGDVVPNKITFVAVLGACRHVGLVDEGRKLFDSMKEIYKIEPNVKHYSCMVDLLGRAGFLREAEDLIETMPMAPDVATWGALLGACRKHGESEMGERIGRRLVELEPEHDGFRVLLSNIYACRGKWDNAMEMRHKMKQQSVVKIPGCSSLIHANNDFL